MTSRDARNAAWRGVILTALAVVSGVFVLARGFGQTDDIGGPAASQTIQDTESDSATSSPDSTDNSDSVPAADDTSSDTADIAASQPAEPGYNPDTTDTNPEDDASENITETTTTVTTTTAAAAETPAVSPPTEVKVVTVNGKGVAGLAGAAAGVIAELGYVTSAKNAESVPAARSAIYYHPSYENDAEIVAVALSASSDLLEEAPTDVLALISAPDDVADFHIFVMLGDDDHIPVTVPS